MDTKKINAEVVSVFPNKIKISVEDLEDFQIAEEKLKSENLKITVRL